MKITRRQLLAAGGGTLLAGTALRAGFDYLGRKISDDEITWRFMLPLRIPPTLSPVCSDAETDFYSMTQKEADVEILPGKRTRIWGYEGMFPGPTTKARRGQPKSGI